MNKEQNAKAVASRLKGHKPKDRNIIRVACVMDVELGDTWIDPGNTDRIIKNMMRAFSTNERILVKLKHRVVARATKARKGKGYNDYTWPDPMPPVTDRDKV